MNNNVKTLNLSVGHYGSDFMEGKKVIESARSNYGTSLEIFNFTEEEYYFQDRLGAKQKIPSMLSMARALENDDLRRPIAGRVFSTPGIYISFYFTFYSHEAEKIYRQYKTFAPDSFFYQKICQSLEETIGNRLPYSNQSTISATIVLDESAFHDNKPVYISELGIVISNMRGQHLIEHPESIPDIIRVRSNYVGNDIVLDNDPAHVAVRAYVSNSDRKYNKLYVKLLNHVQEIPIIYNPTDGFNGIEVYSKRPCGSEHGTSLVQRFTFDEAFQTLGVATNIHDAETFEANKYKQLDLEYQQQLTAAKTTTVELQRKTNELTQMKLNHDREMLQLKEDSEREKRLFEERLMEFKKQQLEKDIELKRMTEEHAKWKLKTDREDSELKYKRDAVMQKDKIWIDAVRQSMGFAGQLLSFILQVTKK